jgi:hypothetical protein
VWERSLGPDDFDEPVIIFRHRAIVISPKIALSEDTITGKKIGQNVGTVRIV